MKVRFPSFTLELDPEDGWTVSTIILSGPEPEADTPEGKHPRFRPNIIIAMEQVNDTETNESYRKRQHHGLKKSGVPVSEVELPVEVVLDNGTKGLICEQSVFGPYGDRIRQLQLVTIKNGTAYTFVASDLGGKKSDSTRRVLESIMWSLEVT